MEKESDYLIKVEVEKKVSLILSFTIGKLSEQVQKFTDTCLQVSCEPLFIAFVINQMILLELL
ncbi:hypothetical protein J7E63_14330 [Bacillus sp. ISL-75]|nr:hypothetical protein [Bacillus sp. ISL-75]